MRNIKFKEFKNVVGQSFITMKTHNFPAQGWCRKTVDNVIYIWAKPDVAIMKISDLEKATGKDVKFSIVPSSIIKYAGI